MVMCTLKRLKLTVLLQHSTKCKQNTKGENAWGGGAGDYCTLTSSLFCFVFVCLCMCMYECV